jgi:hypothetical protein
MQMGWALVRIGEVGLLAWLHTEQRPPDAEWDSAVAEIARRLDEGDGGSRAALRGFVVSDGFSPNTRQRDMLHEEVCHHVPLRASVVLASMDQPLARGVATALRWINRNYGFFAPEDVDGALAHIGLAGELRALWDVYRKLQLRLPPVAALGRMGRAKGLPPLAAFSETD